MITRRVSVPGSGPTDEECMEELARRKPGALQTLFDRYAPLVFHIASQSLDPGSAEDIVQDVFVSVWRKADTFDPAKGALKSWLLQVAHFRILNELRSRSRRPRLDPEMDPRLLEDVPDPNAGPAEAVLGRIPQGGRPGRRGPAAAFPAPGSEPGLLRRPDA